MTQLVRIISDLHLGHPVSRLDDVASLRPLIRGAAKVIFNGDTWQPLASSMRIYSGEMLEELQTLCAEENCEPIFLPGNHDPDWAGPGWYGLENGRVIITHGDAIFHDGSPWKREIIYGQKRIAEIWAQHPAAAFDIAQRLSLAREIARQLPSHVHATSRGLLQRIHDAITPPVRSAKILEAWWRQGQAAAAFADRYFPRAEVLCFGHTHCAGSWKIRGRLILNTGSFFNPGAAHFVELHNRLLRHGAIDESTSECKVGNIKGLYKI